MSKLIVVSLSDLLRERTPTKTISNIKEQKSKKLSKFQSLGSLFRSADMMAEGDVVDKLNVLQDFGNKVDSLGFDYYAPLHLLSSPNWKIRMSTAWCLIGDAERNIARQLDYDIIHNFWPDTSFCEVGWDDEVKRWFTSLPCSLNVSTELKIAAFVGQPSRDVLVFAD